MSSSSGVASSSSFGRWYEEKKNEDENGGDSSSSNWFGVPSFNALGIDDTLPLFNTDAISNNLQNFSFTNMKAAMEQQMPKKILGLNYQQRFKVFCGLLFLSALFFALAFFVGMPMITLRPQKFALSFTCGSLTFMSSFAIMKGPVEHITSLFQADRLLFTFIYFGSIFLTLYCTFSFGGASGYILVISTSAAQLLALAWYLISFLPGGTAGLQYLMAVMCHLLRPVIVVCAKWQAICVGKCFAWMTGLRSGSSA